MGITFSSDGSVSMDGRVSMMTEQAKESEQTKASHQQSSQSVKVRRPVPKLLLVQASPQQSARVGSSEHVQSLFVLRQSGSVVQSPPQLVEGKVMLLDECTQDMAAEASMAAMCYHYQSSSRFEWKDVASALTKLAELTPHIDKANRLLVMCSWVDDVSNDPARIYLVNEAACDEIRKHISNDGERLHMLLYHPDKGFGSSALQQQTRSTISTKLAEAFPMKKS